MTARCSPCGNAACANVPDLCTCGGMCEAAPTQAAEACTELGADAGPKLSLWRRVRIAYLRWQIACLRDEREQYIEAGLVGPIYLRESLSQQLALMARLRQLRTAPEAMHPLWPPALATMATALIALTSAFSLGLGTTGVQL